MASMHQPESSRHATISTIAHDVIRCLKAFEALFSVSESSAERDANEPVINRLRDQLSRFRLWSGNIGAHRKGRSSLDYRLRDSSHLQQQVSKLLRKLMQNIEEATSILTGEYHSDQEDEDALEYDPNDLPDLQKLGFDSELDSICASIRGIVDCLLRLSMSFRDPAPHDRFIFSKDSDTSFYEAYDTQHVRSKFGDAEDFLVVRLGMSISRRRQYFKYRESQHRKLAEGIDSTSGQTEAQSTIASSIPRALKDSRDQQQLQTDADDRSDTGFSQTSFATTVPDAGKPQVPPLPRNASDGPFECPFCYRIIATDTAAKWKKHVLADLRPYVCLAHDCLVTGKDYERRHEWIQHVLQNHPRTSAPDMVNSSQQSTQLRQLPPQSQCPLCKANLRSVKEYQTHVGRHQVELALFALPKLPLEDKNGLQDEQSISGHMSESSSQSNENDQNSFPEAVRSPFKHTGDLETPDDIRPKHTRMARRHVSLETLRACHIEYQLDNDPEYVVINRCVSEEEQDMLRTHTEGIRQARWASQCREHGCNGMQFYSFSDLSQHQREHTSRDGKFSCLICGAEFEQKSELSEHWHHQCRGRSEYIHPEVVTDPLVNDIYNAREHRHEELRRWNQMVQKLLEKLESHYC